MSNGSDKDNSRVRSILSLVSPYMPSIKYPHTLRPASFACLTAFRASSTDASFRFSFKTRSLPDSHPKLIIHHPADFISLSKSKSTESTRELLTILTLKGRLRTCLQNS